jgi:penicillin-binding protein 1A
VLDRMLDLDYIDQATADAAALEPVGSRGYALLTDVDASFVAELARQRLVRDYGPSAVNLGYKVYNTIGGARQTAVYGRIGSFLKD